jgi:general stress protein 26
VSQKSLADVAKVMRDIDIAIFSTVTADGVITTRPMSNNRDVDFDGDSYYFTSEETETVRDIEANPHVALGLQGDKHTYVAVTGKADLVRDKAAFEEHWNPDLDEWFEDGADTPGVVMIHVKAEKVHYWDGREGGDVKL